MPTSDHMKSAKKMLNDRIFRFLKQHGYKRKGNLFTLSGQELNYYIQIQYSVSSTSRIARFTINLAITSNALLENEDFIKPAIFDSHWRRRIGHYRANPGDYWWTIDSVDLAEKAADQVIHLLETGVVPEWTQLQTTEDMLSIWEKDIAQGITEVQRRDFINVLKQRS